jgi:hypothetical protein
MVDGLHILKRNRTKKPLAVALSGAGRGLKGRDGRGDLTNISLNGTVTMNPPLYNEYSLIKKIYNLVLVAHVCNPRYSGGRDQEDHGLKPTQANSSRDSILKKNIIKIELVEWLKV